MPIRFQALKVTVAPQAEPLTLAVAKAQLRILHADEDAYITGLISVARRWAEDNLRRALITQTIVAQYPCWPSQYFPNLSQLDSTFVIPRPPLISVGSVKYYDQTDTLITLDPTNYVVDIIQDPGTVRIKQTAYSVCSSLCLSKNYVNPVSITFNAGYGATATAIDSRILQAMLIIIAHLYERRTIVEVDTRIAMIQVPLSASELISPLRLRLV